MAYIEMKHSYKRYKTGDVEIIANNDIHFRKWKRGVSDYTRFFWGRKINCSQYSWWYGYQWWGKVSSMGRHHPIIMQRQLTYRRDDVGFVFQFCNLVSNLTAENVELASRIIADAKDAEQTLIDVGLENASNFFLQLSGGEQQRVSLAPSCRKCSLWRTRSPGLQYWKTGARFSRQGSQWRSYRYHRPPQQTLALLLIVWFVCMMLVFKYWTQCPSTRYW